MALRVPGLLYRARLGWLLGNRFLYLIHRGRKSGKTRRAVLEIVRFDGDLPEATVVAGWGPQTQWYRNLEVAPAVEVWVGRHRWRRPQQSFLDRGQREDALVEYAREHPRAAKELGRVFGFASIDDPAAVERTRAVAFRRSA